MSQNVSPFRTKRNHIAALLAQGISLETICETVGVSKNHVNVERHRLRYGYIRPDYLARQQARVKADQKRIEEMRRTPDVIPLTKGKIAFIDPNDFNLVAPIRWHAHHQTLVNNELWYAYGKFQGLPIKMHRFILGVPDNVEVDHRDGDGLNNRRGNLRPATRQQNGFNTKRHSTGTVFSGVYYYKANGKWTGQVTATDGRRLSIGYHEKDYEAALARDRLVRAHHGEFARLNFPTELLD